VIVVFGSINLDLIFPVPVLPKSGETVLCPRGQVHPGGKGANQALAAARDGAQTAMAGAVGQDSLADDALALLVAEGIDLTRVVRVETPTGFAGICVDPAGHNQIAVASGANREARAAQVDDALLGSGTTLVLQMECDANETATLIRRARARGTRIVLNLAPAAPLPQDALAALDVLVVNDAEAAWLAGHLGASREAAALHQALGVAIIVTHGEAGAECAAAYGHFRIPAHAVQPRDTTGAGDCFTGVLAAALDRGLALPEALRRANVAAAISCTRSGAQPSFPRAAETDTAL
jgi:ribokinase